MEGVLFEWFSLILRLFHVVAAIAWIGASFYFIWLDLSLKPVDRNKSENGISGEVWSIHGGGIYEVGKYRLAPPEMPTTLHWFKWEAYTTWLTGSALLIVLFYFQAQTYLLGPDSPITHPPIAIIASVLYLIAGLGVYELLTRLPFSHRAKVFSVFMAIFVAGFSLIAFWLFSPRAAAIHLGAMLGTIMAANVFLTIIPSQKSLVAAIENNSKPPSEGAIKAKLRSTHNNYLTIPVLICMLSNHAPLIYLHDHAWIILALLCFIGAWVRVFFNSKHAGHIRLEIPAVASLALFSVIFIAWLTDGRGIQIDVPKTDTGDETLSLDVSTIVQEHCVVCHATNPTYPGFSQPPAGFVFNNKSELLAVRGSAVSSLSSYYMPLGNVTEMTIDERNTLKEWLSTPN
tara:strand:+ start:5732 stop:6934 length:1203 start_codon:yes stop_codon:yes gene_type:complete